ncbi:hypothetical protein HK098_004968 [Nowakowskiella sp. JEL0407]|nr:hypothetical protein HK098_004968 [Nowakowskiella sp. JEL0407]
MNLNTNTFLSYLPVIAGFLLGELATVNVDSISAFLAATQHIGFAVISTGGLTTVLNEVLWTPNSARPAWITILWYLYTLLIANLRLVANLSPQATERFIDLVPFSDSIGNATIDQSTVIRPIDFTEVHNTSGGAVTCLADHSVAAVFTGPDGLGNSQYGSCVFCTFKDWQYTGALTLPSVGKGIITLCESPTGYQDMYWNHWETSYKWENGKTVSDWQNRMIANSGVTSFIDTESLTLVKQYEVVEFVSNQGNANDIFTYMSRYMKIDPKQQAVIDFAGSTNEQNVMQWFNGPGRVLGDKTATVAYPEGEYIRYIRVSPAGTNAAMFTSILTRYNDRIVLHSRNESLRNAFPKNSLGKFVENSNIFLSNSNGGQQFVLGGVIYRSEHQLNITEIMLTLEYTGVLRSMVSQVRYFAWYYYLLGAVTMILILGLAIPKLIAYLRKKQISSLHPIELAFREARNRVMEKEICMDSIWSDDIVTVCGRKGGSNHIGVDVSPYKPADPSAMWL